MTDNNLNENVANQPAEVTDTSFEEATTESIAETIADINAAAVPAKPAKKEKKKKETKDAYQVSNFEIIRNYRHYNAKERKHYKYIFWRRIGSYVWPFFRFVIIFGLSFVIMYPILYMISTSLRPQAEMSDPSVMWIPKTIRFENFTEIWKSIEYPKTLWNTLVLNIVSSVLQVGTCALTG
ncbi:MAG: carbohydrate ABC transporter permease, partial [Oscillospiraceae bacterium]